MGGCGSVGHRAILFCLAPDDMVDWHARFIDRPPDPVFSYSGCLQVGVPGSILAYFVIVSLGYSIMLVLRF